MFIYSYDIYHTSEYLRKYQLPEADRITDVVNSKSAFPMVNKKLEPLFIVFSQ